MTRANPRDELDALRVEYDRKIAALETEMRDLRRRTARRPRPRSLAFIPLAALLALVPLSLFAAPTPFTDLTGGVHDTNIDAIYDAGITRGCDPGVAFCPEDTVTRQEMASFIARAAGLGTNPPVANARTAQTALSATTATSATTAQTAGKLGTTATGGPTYAANELVRTAQAVGTYRRDVNELPVTAIANQAPAYQTVVGVLITAPAAGFVIVNGAVGIGIAPLVGGATEGSVGAGFARLRHVTPGDPASPALYVGVNSGAKATVLSPTFVFPVAAAGQQSFVLEVQKSGTAEVRAFDGVITATYVPFGSAGAGALEGEP